jgi:hypothetical protein
MKQSWDTYTQTEDYANTLKWARTEHAEGSLWAAYTKGYQDATKRAGNLHEQIDNTSDAERLEGAPGAGAMGAVISYRDEIRKAEL